MRKLLLFAIVSVLTGCGTSGKKSEPHWNESMKDLSETLSEVLGKMVLTSGALSESDKQIVINDMDRLSRVSHRIDSTTNVPSKDQSLRIVSREFKSEIKDVSRLMNLGRWPEVRQRTYQLTRYCISCHTLTVGVSSPFTVQFKIPPGVSSSFEKAKYYLAIRQFEQAIIHFEYALTDKKWAAAHPKEWNKGVMMLLAIVTHVKKDANLTLDLLSRFFDTKSYPATLKPSALLWRRQVVQWRERENQVADLAAVESWIKTAEKIKNPEHGGVFLLLRSSSRLHELLSFLNLSKDQEQRALYLAGQAGLELGDLNFLYFPEQYLETCVRLQPKNTLAGQCLKLLKDSWATSPSLKTSSEHNNVLKELKALIEG